MNPPEEQTSEQTALPAPSEAEMLYQRLLDLPLVGLLRVDAAGRITCANARMAEMVGWALGDLEGRSVCDPLFPEDAGRAQERRAARGPTRLDLLGTEGLMRALGALVGAQAVARIVAEADAHARGVFRNDVCALLLRRL